MRQRRGHRENHAEAVEHRDLDHHAVLGGQVHPVPDALPVFHALPVLGNAGSDDVLSDVAGAFPESDEDEL